MSDARLPRFGLRWIFKLCTIFGCAFGVVHWCGSGIFIGAFWGAVLGGLVVFYLVALQNPMGEIEVNPRLERIGLLSGLGIGAVAGLLSDTSHQLGGMSLIVCFVALVALSAVSRAFAKR